MNKILLTFTFGLASIIALQADKFHAAVAELETIGKRPSLTLRDISDTANAWSKLRDVMGDTKSQVIKTWIKEQKAVLKKRMHAKETDSAAIESAHKQMATALRNDKNAAAFYQTTIKPAMEKYQSLDKSALDQALMYIRSALITQPADVKNIFWHEAALKMLASDESVLDKRSLFTAVVEILAALDDTFETVEKFQWTFMSIWADLSNPIKGMYEDIFEQ